MKYPFSLLSFKFCDTIQVGQNHCYIFFQDTAKPVTEFPFPSVTICSPGLDMGEVEEALLDDFDQWLSENGKAEGGLEDQLDEFMKEKYATNVATENIFEKIKAMNLPPPSSEQESSASAVLHNLVACQEKEENGGRKKRSNEGNFNCIYNFHG